MKTKQALTKQQRRQRFFLVLPVLVLPFMTLFFWAMGGGKSNTVMAAAPAKTGINKSIPDAQLKNEDAMDKLSFYDQAAKDSAVPHDQKGKDTGFAVPPADSNTGYQGMTVSSNGYTGLRSSPYAGGAYNDPNEARIYQRLEQLNQALRQPEVPLTSTEQRLGFNGSSSLDGKDVDRLERLMKQMQGGGAEPDPEMEQINGVLDKIMDIQNPERVQQELKRASRLNKENVYAVSAAKEKQIFSLLEPTAINSKEGMDDKTERNGFYSLNSEQQPSDEQNTVEAVIHETQTIVNGSTVKLRLLNDIYVNGRLIPKDNFVFGTAGLNGERLEISITSIRLKKSLFPVSLSVVDIDGIGGIYIPGAISRDVAKQSTDRAIQDLSFGTMSDNIGVQAAGAGLEAAKSLFSKKVKLIKVTVKAGYKVLLHDDKQKTGND
ncbi:conjugative transposon protein TraM [Sphingobacterium detergens]|uniref:Conjugative transposon TraM protein n=1 Tax=Sphingobacterium detergens TaxID=1145106 RepID=A0A420ARU2_SPHD1|nr:conjugative transposon protein TraM [Sphingobacterium detergens]RKE47182.1 conjugative transposon TraM protein [Sphingobacterium detergens]